MDSNAIEHLAISGRVPAQLLVDGLQLAPLLPVLPLDTRRPIHEFEPRGRLELKGIADEIEAFEVLFGDEAETSPSGTTGDQITAIREKLAEINIEQLGDAEREDLMDAVSKLMKG